MKTAHEAKSKLLQVCELIEQALAEGYRIEFSVSTDINAGTCKLTTFNVLQQVKLEN